MTTIPTRILKVTILAIALLAFANNALANKLTISFANGYQAGQGGEFTLKGADAVANTAIQNVVYPTYAASTEDVAGAWSFQSFCIERNEFINNGDVVDYVVNTAAVNGGFGGGNPDPVSAGTATLYSAFATGSLAGYTYAPGAGRQASAAALQNAIWMLEDELAYDGTNTFVGAMITAYGSLANAKANAGAGQGVFALNFTQGGPTGFKQDMLVYGDLSRQFNVPDGGLTLMMLGMGLSGLAVLRRKLI